MEQEEDCKVKVKHMCVLNINSYFQITYHLSVLTVFHQH